MVSANMRTVVAVEEHFTFRIDFPPYPALLNNAFAMA